MNNKNFTNNRKASLLILFPNLLYVEEIWTVFRKSMEAGHFFSEVEKKKRNKEWGMQENEPHYLQGSHIHEYSLTFIDFQ